MAKWRSDASEISYLQTSQAALDHAVRFEQFSGFGGGERWTAWRGHVRLGVVQRWTARATWFHADAETFITAAELRAIADWLDGQKGEQTTP